MSFSAGVCTAVTRSIEGLRQFEIGDGQAVARDLLEELDGVAPARADRRRFAFLLVDGLSTREELLAYSIQEALGEIPVVGGSAGDGLSFASTHVYSNGRFHSDGAVLALISTPLRVKTFKTQHFVPTEERLVVTEADPSRRVVKEINGLPAAEEYARLLGVRAGDLAPIHFAASPVVVLIDGANYVRSIQKANPDGSLTFYCAIERGRGPPRGHGDGPGRQPRAGPGKGPRGRRPARARPRLRLHPAQAGDRGDRPRLQPWATSSGSHNAVGFNTYGEQFCGVHVNQTLTGVALGPGPTEAADA